MQFEVSEKLISWYLFEIAPPKQQALVYMWIL